MSGSKVVVDAVSFQAMVTYLGKCPYQEVAHILVGMQNKIEPYVEPKKEIVEIPKHAAATDVLDGQQKTILEKKVNKKV